MQTFHTNQIDESEYGAGGYFDENSQHQYVLPRTDRFVDESRSLFVFGYAGADGIEFVLKPGESAVYAYMPIDGESVMLAPDFETFMAGWIDGSITV